MLESARRPGCTLSSCQAFARHAPISCRACGCLPMPPNKQHQRRRRLRLRTSSQSRRRLKSFVSISILIETCSKTSDRAALVFPERLLIYNAGTGKTTWVAFTKLGTIVLFAFGCLVIAPRLHYHPDTPWWAAPAGTFCVFPALSEFSFPEA